MTLGILLTIFNSNVHYWPWYGWILLYNFAAQIKNIKIMIEIPQNEVQINDFDNVVTEVLAQLQTGKDKYGEGLVGTTYIDWGVTSDYYQNCPSKRC